MKNLWLPLLLGILITAVLFPLGIVFGKSGGKIFEIIFFPYTSLLVLVLPNASGSIAIVLGYALFFLQYPFYGAILKIALDGGKFYKRLLFLLCLHILAAVVCFAIYQRWNLNRRLSGIFGVSYAVKRVI